MLDARTRCFADADHDGHARPTQICSRESSDWDYTKYATHSMAAIADISQERAVLSFAPIEA
jgi:hypothetical protein